MIACSDVNSDGSKILVTASPTGQPDVFFLYDTRSRNKTQITKYGGIDVGGQFVENDSKIVLFQIDWEIQIFSHKVLVQQLLREWFITVIIIHLLRLIK